MARKAKKMGKGYKESKMPMKKMPKPPSTTSPNSADMEMKKLMENRGFPRKKAK